MTTPDQQPEWSRARGLLAEFKTAARKGVSAQILLGKELSLLKKKLGFTHGSQNRFSPKSAQSALGVSQGVTEIEEPKTWDQWCQAELGVTRHAVDRWIACFEYALGRAKAHKADLPEAFRLLVTPAVELTGDELELLAEHVGRLVRWDEHDSPLTQTRILEELAILKTPHRLTGGDTSEHKKMTEQQTFEFYAVECFAPLHRGVDDLERHIFNTKDRPSYKILMEKLPLTAGPDAPSLYGIKENLERILHGGLATVLKDVETAIQARMHGPAPKRIRKKPPTTARP